MTMTQRIQSDEKGNALFLILIAVVLFAALSYAITQSNRGGGAPNRETSLVASTTIMQYSSAIRTGITRQLLRNVAIADLDFTDPSTACVAGDDTRVFCPDGGGVAYQEIDLQAVNSAGTWNFYTNITVTDVGTASADLVAVLTEVKQPICERIAKQVRGETATVPASGLAQAAIIGGATLTGAGIDGNAFGCVGTTDSKFVYYHVMVEN